MSTEPVAHVDFETRSTVELRASGVHKYAKDPNTGVWCMAWAIGDMEPQIWRPGNPFPKMLEGHINAGRIIYAHNAQFERTMWRECCVPRYNFPLVADDQWHCTAAMAAALSLPRSLGDCAAVLGLVEQKDKEGAALMIRMARPRKYADDGTPIWWDVPERRARLEEYCAQDVRTERAIEQKLRALSSRERKVYLLDQVINDRGVRIDRTMAVGCAKIIVSAQDKIDETLRALTDDEVTKVTQTGSLKRWMAAQGVETESVNKATVAKLLEEGDLPNAVREVLLARQEAGKSSVAKVKAMLDFADEEDDRMRGLFLYHGASTGRWSGRGPQPQNLPRGDMDVTEEMIEQLKCADPNIDSPFAVVSSAVRKIICAAPGKRLIAGDFAAIEARVLAWCAGETTALLEYERGEDRYIKMAAVIYKIAEEEVQKFPHRQLGKTAILGCGFGMGGDKFCETANAAGISIDVLMAHNVVAAYRRANPKTVRWWTQLERAAVNATKNPGKVFTAGRVKYAVSGNFLWCLLPSGRRLAYPKPEIVKEVSDKGYERDVLYTMGPVGPSRKWGRVRMWRGLLAENVVQAVARDVLVEAMFRLEEHRYFVIMSIHDEIVSEVENSFGSLDAFLSLLKKRPDWAYDLPIDAEAWEGTRYRK